jgi:hypothetical protein
MTTVCEGSCSDKADKREGSSACIASEGSLRLRSKPKAFPEDSFFLFDERLFLATSSTANASFGELRVGCDCGRLLKPSAELVFNHAPSLSSVRRNGEDFCGLFQGLSSRVVPNDTGRFRDEGGLGVLKLRTEDMLLLTECPRMVDKEPSVSDEMVDNGRGMYSTFSENSTRGLDDGLVGESFTMVSSNCALVGVAAGSECSIGVVGRLLLNRCMGSGDGMKWLISCPDMAVERRWR